ncbi:hypothetical protein [Aquamicrobium sp. LC103]|uniref:hypothetical protein n=1 Tax=Aquamicrobium sp. LC103 TaxID=1120658 RepID=UPI000AB33283|nr:hypothetical protein [Aquamicrobium sp. LC103]TKT79292.1 hypothetical protein XW59_010235 [Aquamicrobium sp. LC103]
MTFHFLRNAGNMGLLGDLLPNFFSRAKPIRTVGELAEFMDSRAAFMGQKCVEEFSRVRAGIYWQKLFSEEEFQTELRRSRWKSYPPAYAMVAEAVESVLRPAAGLRQRKLPEALEKMASRTFAGYPVPEGLSDQFWSEALELLRERLDATQADAPRPVREMAEPAARLVFEALPIHQNLLTNDYDYIFNNLRMNLLRVHSDFLDRVDAKAVILDLLGDD